MTKLKTNKEVFEDVFYNSAGFITMLAYQTWSSLLLVVLALNDKMTLTGYIISQFTGWSLITCVFIFIFMARVREGMIKGK